MNLAKSPPKFVTNVCAHDNATIRSSDDIVPATSYSTLSPDNSVAIGTGPSLKPELSNIRLSKEMYNSLNIRR